MLHGLLLVAAPFVYVATKQFNKHNTPKKLGTETQDVTEEGEDWGLDKPAFIKKLPGWVTPLRQRMAALDNRVQTLVQTHIDAKLMGKAFSQQIMTMTGGKLREPAVEEKRFNRAILLNGIGFGLLATSHFLAWPVTPLILGVALYNLWPLLKESFTVLYHERRVSLVHLLFFYFSGLWLGGYYLIGLLGLALFSVSQKMLFLSQTITRHSLTDLLGEQPQTVWVLVDGSEVEVPFAELNMGDVLILNAGQPVPVDGVIIEGSASIDQHRLTGESQPVEKAVGDPVLAGTLVLGGRVSVSVEKTGSETSAAKISAVLENTVDQRDASVAEQYRAFESTLVPTVFGSAAGFLVGGPVMASAILGCNYFLNLASLRSLTLLNGLKSNAECGVLVKDGQALETIPSIDTVVFDKTGTLTVEQPRIDTIHCAEGYTEDQVLTFAAAAEQRQSHPIAQAIIAAAESKQLTLPDIDEAHYQLGLGLTVEIDDQHIRVGSAKFLASDGIRLPTALKDAEAAAHAQGQTIVFVAVDNDAIGGVELASSLRPETQSVVDWLKSQGIALYILSGDQEAPTKTLADTLGLDGYWANTLPEQKAQHIKALQDQGRKVCFVGDGINDAIALNQADVSISLRGATTIATDSAKIVLMNDNLEQLIKLWKLAKGLNTNVNGNTRTAGWFGVAASAGVVLLPFKFLVVEALWGTHMISGIKRAYQPLLPAGEADTESNDEQPAK